MLFRRLAKGLYLNIGSAHLVERQHLSNHLASIIHGHPHPVIDLYTISTCSLHWGAAASRQSWCKREDVRDRPMDTVEVSL